MITIIFLKKLLGCDFKYKWTMLVVDDLLGSAISVGVVMRPS